MRNPESRAPEACWIGVRRNNNEDNKGERLIHDWLCLGVREVVKRAALRDRVRDSKIRLIGTT
jgi:hypothetical protein